MEKVRNYMVEPIQFSAAKPFVEKWHYSKSVHGLHITQCFGLFKEGNFGFPKMIGAMMYGVPSSMHGQTTSKYGNESGKILELNRLCCIDDTPTNTESYFLGSSMRWLKKYTDYQVK